MENFGLGLVLSFQDNASSRIEGIIGALHHLQEALNSIAGASSATQTLEGLASTMGIVGGAATALGGAIVGMTGKVVSSITHMSAGFERNIMALTQMYGSTQKAKDEFIALERLAAKTPLGMEVIQSAATRLKTVGVEAHKTFNVMVDGTKKARSLLEVLGDLSVMRPDKSMDDVIREGIEFIEGNARPLKMSFGLDVKSSENIGEALAGTAEGRLDQLVRMIEKAGYTGALDKTNDMWDTIFQNLKDNVTVLAYYVGMEGGLFEQIKAPFKELFNYLSGLLDQKGVMKDLGKSIADGLKMVVAPALGVLRIMNSLLKMVVQFATEHPKIVSATIAFVGLAGQIVALGGVALVTVAIFAKFRLMLMTWAGSMGIVNRVLSVTRFGFMALARSILPVTIALGALYYAWNMNILGIRTLTEGGLRWISDFLSILVDALSNINFVENKAFMHRSKVNLAKEMGIFDFIQGVQKAAIYVHTFFSGISAGVEVAVSKIKSLGQAIQDTFKGTPLEPLITNFQNSVNPATKEGKDKVGVGGDKKVPAIGNLGIDHETNAQAREFGNIVGHWIPVIMGAVAGFRLLSMGITTVRVAFRGLNFVADMLGGLLTPIRALGRLLLQSLGSSALSGIGTSIVNFIANPLRAVGRAALMVFRGQLSPIFALRMLGTQALLALGPVRRLATAFTFGGLRSLGTSLFRMAMQFTRIRGVIGVLLSPFTSLMRITLLAGRAIFNFVQLARNIGTIPAIIMRVLQGIQMLGRAFQALRLLFVGNPVGLAILAIGLAVMFVINHWEEFQKTASEVWGHIKDTVDAAWGRLKPIFEQLWGKVQELWKVFEECFPEIAKVIKDWVGDFSVSSDTAQAIFDVLGTAVKVAFDIIVTVIELAIDLVVGALNVWITVAKGVVEFFTKVFQGDISGAFGVVKDTIIGILGDIGKTFDSFINTIKGGIARLRGETVETSNNLSAEAADNAIKNMNVNHRKDEAIGDILMPEPGGITVRAAEAGVPEAFIPIRPSQRSWDLLDATTSMLERASGGNKSKRGQQDYSLGNISSMLTKQRKSFFPSSINLNPATIQAKVSPILPAAADTVGVSPTQVVSSIPQAVISAETEKKLQDMADLFLEVFSHNRLLSAMRGFLSRIGELVTSVFDGFDKQAPSVMKEVENNSEPFLGSMTSFMDKIPSIVSSAGLDKNEGIGSIVFDKFAGAFDKIVNEDFVRNREEPRVQVVQRGSQERNVTPAVIPAPVVRQVPVSTNNSESSNSNTFGDFKFDITINGSDNGNPKSAREIAVEVMNEFKRDVMQKRGGSQFASVYR